MKYSQIKQVKAFCESLHSEPDWREVTSNINQGLNDFEVDNVRFISSCSIDSIQQDELSSDLYCLGCFNACYIAEVTGIDQDAIEAMQKAEVFEAVGKLIISLDKLEELQYAYASADGYGHHFNSYDFGEEELRIDGKMYHVFDNR
jgi:hypothetical protein